MNKWESQLERFHSLLEQIREKRKKGKGEFRFNRAFIMASDIATQYFCEKKVEMEYLHGDIETESKILGVEAHEMLLEGSIRVKRKDLWEKIYGKKPVLTHETFLLAEYKDVILAGQPDSILFFRGLPLILFEYKFSRKQRPFRDHHVQAKTYGILLRNMGFDTSRLHYAIVMVRPKARHDKNLKRKVVRAVMKNGQKEDVLTVENARIFINKFDEIDAEKDLDWAIEFWKKEREAMPTRNPNKCKSCEYNTSCEIPNV